MLKFSHGGGIYQFAQESDCQIKDVIDLSSNINFLKPKIDFDFNKLDISYYPDYQKIYETLAKNYGVKNSQIELYSGGSSAIFSLFRSLNLNHCTIYSPAYLEYKKASEIFGYKLTKINRFENIYQKVKKNSLVIFVNPSTPDGKFYNLKKLFKIWKKSDATVLIDESFLDFTTKPSATKYLKNYKKLYILKSMTKFYSCAGVRVGLLLTHRQNVLKLKSSQPLWKLSQFDINYLEQALKDKKFKKKSLNKNRKNRIFLKKILENSNLFSKIYKSKANFILAKLKNITALQLQQKLKPYKIMIRDCANFDFLDESYVRIAVKSKKNLKILLSLL